jgi:hypothetical protein
MKQPKIVIWDLETLPDPEKVYDRLPGIGAWPGRTFKAELHTILSFGYKLYGDKEASCMNSWDLSDNPSDDAALVQFAYDMLHDADEIVTHNGKSFDVKVLNTRLMHYGMPPLDPKIKHVDTKIVLKKISLYSNSLAQAAKFFGIDDKMHWGDKWQTWKRFAFNRDTQEDRDIMDKYCKQDVEVLEQLYIKTRAFHGTGSVNKNHWKEGEGCPTCGSENFSKNGTRRNTKTVYQRYLCGDCGTSFPGERLDNKGTEGLLEDILEGK